MPGKLDHREALRPRGWAGSEGGDAGTTNGEQEKEREEGGGGEERETRRWKRPGHAAAALGLDPVCTVVPDDVFIASLWATRSPVPSQPKGREPRTGTGGSYSHPGGPGFSPPPPTLSEYSH